MLIAYFTALHTSPDFDYNKPTSLQDYSYFRFPNLWCFFVEIFAMGFFHGDWYLYI